MTAIVVFCLLHLGRRILCPEFPVTWLSRNHSGSPGRQVCSFCPISTCAGETAETQVHFGKREGPGTDRSFSQAGPSRSAPRTLPHHYSEGIEGCLSHGGICKNERTRQNLWKRNKVHCLATQHLESRSGQNNFSP